MSQWTTSFKCYSGCIFLLASPIKCVYRIIHIKLFLECSILVSPVVLGGFMLYWIHDRYIGTLLRHPEKMCRYHNQDMNIHDNNSSIYFAQYFHFIIAYAIFAGWELDAGVIQGYYISIRQIEPSAVITMYDIIRYHTADYWGRISIICWTHGRPRGVLCEHFWENWPCYKGTALCAISSSCSHISWNMI